MFKCLNLSKILKSINNSSSHWFCSWRLDI